MKTCVHCGQEIRGNALVVAIGGQETGPLHEACFDLDVTTAADCGASFDASAHDYVYRSDWVSESDISLWGPLERVTSTDED